MITVGVTGGIGSGKSTVCDIWAQLGAYVLNADDLAKQVMVTNAEVKQQLVDRFGSESFLDDGELNTEHLANEAFEKGRVQELNAIVHPKLPAAASQKMEEAEAQGYEVFVYEAALLLENLEPGSLDYTVLVLADEDHRIERVKQRDNSSEVEIKQRIKKQRNFEKSTERVDYVIRNNGTLEELEKKAEIVYQSFLTEREA
ncbi:dephospho-CoA kinase [Aliifodinibius salipaludis]|uniref:Dephospho-CoA kinase n=1 Tax=Fodinibius salipaludis TaxID=2032627 RepID=A0A2A2G8M2_9BACT|nr:dephospho-CoA kinase [Aliifodinibius salipaludis]PAU93961.1 dephospho-CoA kinase [Aliifodinibius salipaludis]